MRPRTPRCHVLFLALFLAATPVFSQEHCQPGDTITGCIDRYMEGDTSIKSLMKQERSDLKRQPTGVDTGGANAATNTKDFNPLMALAGLLGTDTDGIDSSQGTLVLNLNFPLPLINSKGARNAQLQALLNSQPELSELVRSKIPAADRDAAVSQLEEEIPDLADHTIRLTYNHTNQLLGRSFKQHEEDFQEVCRATMRKTVLRNLGLRSDLSVQGMSPEMAATTLQRVDEEARKLMDSQGHVLRDANVEWYDQLLDNQPQFQLTVDGRFRDPLIGPDELSVNVTYEWSMVNLNAAMEHCGTDWGSATCGDWFKEKKDDIEKGYRFSFSGEYTDSEGETIDTGIPGVAPIALESARTLKLSAGLSFKIPIGEMEDGKLDLVASYEDIGDDPNRQDRGIASLTFTRKVGMMDIPFSIVYANHGEFIPDVDARLSAHIGLKFNMSGGNGDQ